MNDRMPMPEFMETRNVKTIFLEYNSIIIKIKKYIKWKEMPLYEMSAPGNSSLNVLLNLSTKGVSKLYTRMKDSFSHELDNAVDKWREY